MLLATAMTAALTVPAAGLGRLARRHPADARWLLLLAAAAGVELVLGAARLLFELSGWAVVRDLVGPLSLVSPLLLLAGLVTALRARLEGLRLNVLLDGLAGALAAAAVAALAVAPLVQVWWDGSWAAAVLVGRPLVDAVLVSAGVGALGLLAGVHSRQLGVWAVAVVTLAASDTLRATGTGSTPGEAAWPAALTLVGYAVLALGAVVPPAEQVSPVPGPRSVTVPALASLAAVAVLTVAPAWDQTRLPTVLALVTLMVCAVRFVRVFLQLRELADIRQQALTDELTGLPNRRALYLQLDALLDLEGPARATASAAGVDVPEASDEFTVALIDLDHFKEVNDTLGHAVGDALLKGVTQRFTAALEELETPFLFARLGGDEFAIVLHEAGTRNAAVIVGEALVESLAAPLQLDGAVVHAQASIGLALAPSHGRTRSEVLFAADAAMYAAKSTGERVRFHAPNRDAKTAQLALAEELYRALEQDEIVVEYQPVCTPDGGVVAAEALVRWQHPERGTLLPEAFLGAAERYRLSEALTRRVLDLGLRDLRRWRAYGVPLTLTVNLAAAELRDETVVASIAEALLDHGLPAEVLTIDVAEADLCSADQARVGQVLRSLDELGVRLALDDYGVGGVGIATLAELPFDEVKLERRFVRDVAVSATGTAVVRATLDLVHALGMHLVAEGVEDRRALARLTELGVDLVQGHQVGRPGPARELEKRLTRPTGGKHRLVPDQPGSGDERRRRGVAADDRPGPAPLTTSGP
ncbi:MAG TPA: EAL domain-containing protein [Nocardioides sp.]|nr:EAL domain-containing protein [Nocardioides sp.]